MPPSPALLETQLEGLTLHRRGKVRDVYEVGHDLLIVATDRISAFDFVLGSGIPDKGKVLTQMSAFWFEHAGRRRAQPRDQRWTRTPTPSRRGGTPTCCAAARCWCAGPSRCRSSAWRAGTSRARAGRSTGRTGARLRHRAARRACGSRTGCPSPSSRRRPRPRAGTTSTSREAEAGGIVGAARIARLRDLTLALYSRGARARRGAAASSSPTPSSSSAWRRGRRGPRRSSSSTRR